MSARPVTWLLALVQPSCLCSGVCVSALPCLTPSPAPLSQGSNSPFPLVALGLQRQEETMDTQRGQEVGIFFQWRGWTQPLWFGITRKKMVRSWLEMVVSLNLNSLRQSQIQTGMELEKWFASLYSSFGNLAVPGVLTNVLGNAMSLDDYTYTRLMS